MERLELSKQKLLGPKSSASANFATSVFVVLLFFINKSLIFLKIYSSSVYMLYTKLVVLPCNIDLAKDNDF